MESAVQSTPKVGVFKRGWRLTKSAWHVWRLDKELTSLPFISLFVTVLVLIPFGLIVYSNTDFSVVTQSATTNSEALYQSDLAGWIQLLLLFTATFLTTLVVNFFSGAVIYGAVQRFKGGDPTVKTSLAGAARKFGPLAMFSLLMTTVGLILQFLEERLPFASRIAVFLFDAAWNIANIFAIPVIVLSEKSVSPLQATRQSVQIIKKVWGEGIIVSIGIGVIAMITYFVYAATFLVAGFFAFNAGGNAPAITIGVVGIIGLLALIMIFSTLGSIAKAALYQFAVTGEAPGPFDKDLLRSSMTPKKASKIFR